MWINATFNIGDIAILIAVVIWGLFSVVSSKAMRRRSSISTTAYSIFIGLPFLTVLAIWEQQTIPIKLDWQVISIIIYLGVVPAAVGFFTWNMGVARLGASGAMVFYNTLPLYGALLGIIFLGEPCTTYHILGGMLIVGGGMWAAREQPAKSGGRLSLED